MNIRSIPLRFVLLFQVTILFVTSTAACAAERPNVLLILVDDLKPSFGAYGEEWVHSPNLDRLAERGMRFDMAYCNQAVCAPSRNNLLVGSRSTTLGVYGLGTNFRKSVPDAVTLPQYFKQHGYHSSGIGKVFHIGHGNVGDDKSWSEPFHPDKVIDYVLPESTGGELTREEAYFSNQELGNIRSLPRGAAWEAADVEDNAYADGRIANEAIRQLKDAKERDKPFFMAVGFTKPHLPFCAPQKYWDLYDLEELPGISIREYPAGSPSYAAKSPLGELNQYKPIPQSPPLTQEQETTLIHGYYAALSYMDAQLGRVIDELDELGLADETLVVLWGDHGYHLGDHGAWTKHTNYEQANRIPILVVAPGTTTLGTSSAALVETVDIFPTLTELAGLPAPQDAKSVKQTIDGKSLVPLLKNPESRHRGYAYHCFPRGKRLGRAIRTDRYRLVEWKPFGASADQAVYELFDYVDDPLESKNLAEDRPDIVQQLSAILDSLPAPKARVR
ncbi:Choline-sulfatase [Thalassoglobus neptunius]|uniref:Choline-sulfatase n=1 Tax=Thalassoglobus neptunius TaxID=1938619 RepID=A0A5C5X1R1_9PLAN|nr:sulfatase [Thalassoglobus neptunius]TWT56768.1 Choline-sulfatase [Thalassoglobus neptunius]